MYLLSIKGHSVLAGAEQYSQAESLVMTILMSIFTDKVKDIF